MIQLVKKLYTDQKTISSGVIKEILLKNIEETPEPTKQECEKEIENKIAEFSNDADGKKLVDYIVETSKNPLCPVVNTTYLKIVQDSKPRAIAEEMIAIMRADKETGFKFIDSLSINKIKYGGMKCAEMRQKLDLVTQKGEDKAIKAILKELATHGIITNDSALTL